MGEARRRRTDIEAIRAEVAEWRDKLPSEHRLVADAAMGLHARFIRARHFVGGCYLLAFFLRRFLRREHGVEARAVVGYVCDGTTPLRASHAWLEFEGKKTDVSLTITEYPEIQLPGELIVLDRVLQRGAASCTYHLSQSHESLAKIAESSAQSDTFAQTHAMKEREHAEMLERAANDDAMEAFLALAPAEVSYRVMAAAIQRR